MRNSFGNQSNGGVHVFSTSTKPTRLISSPEPWWTMKISTAEEDLIYTSLCYSDLLLVRSYEGNMFKSQDTGAYTALCTPSPTSYFFIFFTWSTPAMDTRGSHNGRRFQNLTSGDRWSQRNSPRKEAAQHTIQTYPAGLHLLPHSYIKVQRSKAGKL